MHPIVIDTNIFISALIKEGLTREIITNSSFSWSEDKHFQKQKEIKIFTTKEMGRLDNER